MRTVTIRGIGRVFVCTQLVEIVIDGEPRKTSTQQKYEPEARFNSKVCRLIQLDETHYTLERYEDPR